MSTAPPDRSRWQRLREVFEGAIARAPEERARFLDRACRDDPSLRAEVQLLLAAHDQAGTFLESPAAQLAFSGAAADPSGGEEQHGIGAGDLVSHYLLEQRLGAGGMGVVYLARDLALGRPAAVKILPDAFSPVLRRRLRAEAEACVRLQHPAIATYYGSGESNGTEFIAMEFVPGRTLRARLGEGPVPVDEAVAIAECLLEGLSHAHAAGILHCDVKPENIVVTGSRSAKLLDFGLARTVASADPGGNRVAGAAVAGTVGYMSPEQIRNEPLDVRSDLFQVGAVLYEMLTGLPAFPGANATERLAAVLSRDPDPLTGDPAQAGLGAVLARTLDRDPDRRYGSAGSMLAELARVSAGEWSADLPDTLAVLDFQNLAGVADDDWIGTGVTESIALALRGHPGIQLAPAGKSRSAQAACQAGTLEGQAAEVGLALGCRWVLTGHYRRAGSDLRLTTQLVESSTGRVAHAGEIDGPLEQIFDLQNRIVATTCASLAVAAADGPHSPRPTLPAYECYARGQRLMLKRNRGAFDQAQRLFEEAVRLDPRFAQALAGLAQISALRYTYTSEPGVLDAALAYAQRAIEARATLAEAYVWLGYAHHRLGNLAASDMALARCRELDPREVFGFYFGVGGEHWRRDHNRSLELLQRAVALDPQFGLGWWGLGSIHLELGRYPEAGACFERCSRLNTVRDEAAVPGVEGYWAESLRLRGDLQAARLMCLAGLDAVEKSDFMYRDTIRVFCLVTLGRTAADQGDLDAARAAFRQAIGHVSGRPGTLAGGMLSVQALACLARIDLDDAAYEDAVASYAARARHDFSWLWLCDDARTCTDLAAAAQLLSRRADAQHFLERAARFARIAPDV